MNVKGSVVLRSGAMSGNCEAGTTARVIKRYANRKLYDTQESRYVTLEQIAALIRVGEEVRIVDNTSKEDLTSVTLAQIIFEEEKKKNSFLSLAAMRSIIQSGGVRIEGLVSQAKKGVTGVLDRRQADGVANERSSVESPVENGNSEGWPAIREMRDWIDASQRKIDEFQKKVDDRVRTAVFGINPIKSLQQEVISLTARVGELQSKLTRLGKSGKDSSSGESNSPER